MPDPGVSGLFAREGAQKITWVLKLVEELNLVPATYFKKLAGTEKIWECRITFGSNAYRIFCFFAGNSVVVHAWLHQAEPENASG